MSQFELTLLLFWVGMIVSVAHLALLLKGSSKWSQKDPYDQTI